MIEEVQLIYEGENSVISRKRVIFTTQTKTWIQRYSLPCLTTGRITTIPLNNFSWF